MDPASQAHMDTLARQLGYRDYATYVAAKRNQQALLGAGVTQQKPITWGGQQPIQGPAQQPAPAPQNWFQKLIGALNPGAH